MKLAVFNLAVLPRWRRGYSLIELLIGMTILIIALSSAFVLTINTTRINARNRSVATAANLAEYKLEELRNADPVALVSGSDTGLLDSQGVASEDGKFSRSWAIAADTPETGLYTVVVTVSWAQLGGTETYTLSGVI
jgi:prepilin-type N-terminal cleavage/methylation domain-containing protein